MDLEVIKKVIEAALLASGKPLSVERLQALFEAGDAQPDRKAIRAAVDALQDDCTHRGIELIEVASGYRFQVKPDVAPWVSRLWEERPPRYSRALLETLALIAYRQPITRAEIEEVRGVSVSTSIIKTLTERDWIRVVGHRDIPGRPAIYGTTRTFLDYFGLKSLDELPSLAELRDYESINAELDLHLQPVATGEAPEVDVDGEDSEEASAQLSLNDATSADADAAAPEEEAPTADAGSPQNVQPQASETDLAATGADAVAAQAPDTAAEQDDTRAEPLDDPGARSLKGA